MTGIVAIDDELLRRWCLPAMDEEGDKESRGRVLVIAGSREMPGAALLSATAALRAGAGKLVIATPASAAPTLAAAMPEARVLALPESADGGLLPGGLEQLAPLAAATAAVVAGPGMIDSTCTPRFIEKLLPLFAHSTVLLDALAMDCIARVGRFRQPLILTPHAGEMAHLTGRDKDSVQDQAHGTACALARSWNAVLALKGADTVIADPAGGCWLHRSRTPGLGTSGSGDVLAGIIGGLAARGASPQQAAVWGVALHARAGQALAQRTGSVGYLARELPGEIPALMHGLAAL